MRSNKYLLLYFSLLHSRPNQIFHRLRLIIKRFLISSFASKRYKLKNSLALDKHINLSPILPKRIFKPRKHLTFKKDNIRYVNFLNVKKSLVFPINWHPKNTSQLWRFNLHYMEFLESLDNNEWISFAKDWIQSNKAYSKNYWMDSWSAYTVSIRVVVWMQLFEKCKESIPNHDKKLILQSLLAQIRFLKSNLELDVGGNHILKNVKALLWASYFFSGEEALTWRKMSIKIFQGILNEQITKDGVHFELSPAYHSQVFADLLECYSILDDISCLNILDELLPKMGQFLIDSTHPDGKISLFNDSGLNMSYQTEECLEVYESFFDKKLKQNKIIFYDSAGYYGLRSKDNFILFDAAELAAKYLPAHGHGDALSFEWSIRGQRVFIDPGVFEYTPGHLRDYSSSTKSHNTVTLDNLDQSEFWKSFRVGRRASIIKRSIKKELDNITITASHNGYMHLSGSPEHQRKIAIKSEEINIVDEIKNGNGQIAEARLMLSPEMKYEIVNNKFFILGNDFKILVNSTNPIRITNAYCFLDFGYMHETNQLIINFGKAPCQNKISLNVIIDK